MLKQYWQIAVLQLWDLLQQLEKTEQKKQSFLH